MMMVTQELARFLQIISSHLPIMQLGKLRPREKGLGKSEDYPRSHSELEDLVLEPMSLFLRTAHMSHILRMCQKYKDYSNSHVSSAAE